MGTYGLDGVISAWELEKLTPEQAIGQILQIIAAIEGRLRDLERKYSQLGRTMPPAMSLQRRLDTEEKDQ